MWSRNPILARLSAWGFLLLSVGVSGCKDLINSPSLPAGVQDPTFYSTPAGALGMRSAAIVAFGKAFQQYIVDAGLLTDELEDKNTGASAGVFFGAPGVTDPLDERILPELSSNSGGTSGKTETVYRSLQGVRTLTAQAIGALFTYDTTSRDQKATKVMRGELYALEGYTEIFLADLFCSGVPLSTLDFGKDFTYHAGSTTRQVYQDAILKFDSALAVASASDSVTYLARVGQGRAYLALGQFTVAADDVTTVPVDFQYQLNLSWNFAADSGTDENGISDLANVSDVEGLTGLPFRSSGDPRTAVVSVGVNPNTNSQLFVPMKYSGLTILEFVSTMLASGVEARLIQAEAALNANGLTGTDTTWLHLLNQLRATAPIPGTTQPDSAALPPLSDPVDAKARVDTMFTERAYWLFLDGHRQGDLRRLLRQYSSAFQAFRFQSNVYPTGQYLALGTGTYGSDIDAPIPPTEYVNPLFQGCLSRGE